MAALSILCYTGAARSQLLRWAATSFHTSAALEAARKGTRAKAEAKKAASKKEAVKREFIPLKKRLELKQTGGASPRRAEDHLKNPSDNVWFARFYKQQVYTVEQAFTMHRETHHPTQLDLPDALLHTEVELDMSTDKTNRFIDDFYNVLRLPHDFNTEQERTVLVVSRSEDVQEKAIQMGATHAAGLEIIKQAQSGDINLRDYDHFIAETDILPDFVAVRGLIRKRFPAVRNGTAGTDVLALLERFTRGIEYHTAKDKYHHDYATIRVPFGRLGMSNEQLEDNLSVLLQDVNQQKPNKKSNDLITRAIIFCPPTKWYFKINHRLYLPQSEKAIKVAAAV
ncbi:39S ribosomal protein L1, mitochondrial-like [Portunus trituberculatus]|uniref:39S ribosomal protein L1, mitochondrial-like n=1 Tax=Portunus trituberculatus TaxID=210409 RepID=UPI001E1D09BE|nr:39S ribosomal protein L1, mitochondrial-like [Portunus trituberculatus]